MPVNPLFRRFPVFHYCVSVFWCFYAFGNWRKCMPTEFDSKIIGTLVCPLKPPETIQKDAQLAFLVIQPNQNIILCSISEQRLPTLSPIQFSMNRPQNFCFQSTVFYMGSIFLSIPYKNTARKMCVQNVVTKLFNASLAYGLLFSFLYHPGPFDFSCLVRKRPKYGVSLSSFRLIMCVSKNKLLLSENKAPNHGMFCLFV